MALEEDAYRRKNNRIEALPFHGVLSLMLTVVAGVLLLWQLAAHEGSSWTLAFTGIVFTVGVVTLIWSLDNPDTVAARQTEEMLSLARRMLSRISGGLDNHSAQEVCELLLPNTGAVAVAITNREDVLGYAGYAEVHDPAGGPILTLATHDVIEFDQQKIILNPREIGFPFEPKVIKAAIIIPLHCGRSVFGTLKFYYRGSRKISETQVSIAEGFGALLSTQLSAEALEEQTKLATSMELKALQAQINPHFLFNTINTIASFIRTDPERARVLLREFATFYRHTLENTGDLVSLSREVEQTTRYFHFEVARFGEDKLNLIVEFGDHVEDVVIPAFLIQPLVENAVRHARPTEGMLTIKITAKMDDDILVVAVIDDGVGMSEEQRQAILHPHSQNGLGIAVKNVHDRVENYFGEGSHMEVESELGHGTTVKLIMNLDSENLKKFIDNDADGANQTAKAAASNPAEAPLNQHEGNLIVMDGKNGGQSSALTATIQAPDHATVSTEAQIAAGDVYAAAAASADEVSAAEKRSVEAIAAQGVSSGLTDKVREELSDIDEIYARNLSSGNILEYDDDDWDYEEEMANVEEISDEEWERAIAEYEKDVE